MKKLLCTKHHWHKKFVKYNGLEENQTTPKTMISLSRQIIRIQNSKYQLPNKYHMFL